jgi:hypothetical protein
MTEGRGRLMAGAAVLLVIAAVAVATLTATTQAGCTPMRVVVPTPAGFPAVKAAIFQRAVASMEATACRAGV